MTKKKHVESPQIDSYILCDMRAKQIGLQSASTPHCIRGLSWRERNKLSRPNASAFNGHPPASRKCAINLLNTPGTMHTCPCVQRRKIFAKNIKSSQTPFLCLNIKSWPKHKRGISLGIKMANQKQKTPCFAFKPYATAIGAHPTIECIPELADQLGISHCSISGDQSP